MISHGRSKSRKNEAKPTHRILPAIFAAPFCGERETIRDAQCKVVGTATTDGNKTFIGMPPTM